MTRDEQIVRLLRLLRFAAGNAIICAAFTGVIGLEDFYQVWGSAIGFAGALLVKLAHLA